MQKEWWGIRRSSTHRNSLLWLVPKLSTGRSLKLADIDSLEEEARVFLVGCKADSPWSWTFIFGGTFDQTAHLSSQRTGISIPWSMVGGEGGAELPWQKPTNLASQLRTWASSELLLYCWGMTVRMPAMRLWRVSVNSLSPGMWLWRRRGGGFFRDAKQLKKTHESMGVLRENVGTYATINYICVALLSLVRIPASIPHDINETRLLCFLVEGRLEGKRTMHSYKSYTTTFIKNTWFF